MRRTLASLAAAAAFPAALFAQTTSVTPDVWTGGDGTSSLFADPANWADATAPESSNATIVVFGPGAPLHAVTLPSAFTLGQIQLQSDYSSWASYFFTGDSTLTLHGGLTTDFNSPYAEFDSKVSLVLAGAQTFALQSGNVIINGPISATGKLTITSGDASGWGVLSLKGANSFSGGIDLLGSTLELSGTSPLGTGSGAGAMTIGADTNGRTPTLRTLRTVTVENDLTLQSSLQIGYHDDDDEFGQELTFTGKVTLDGPVFLENLREAPVYFDGSIGEANGPRTLQIGRGVFVLSGANSYTGGTIVGYDGAVVFTSSQAAPAEGSINAADTGYVGAAFGYVGDKRSASGYQDGLIARLDAQNFFGTLGFDTDPDSTEPDNEYASVDVSSLVNFRGLGSLTRALISGPIALGDGQDYRFGGGGGTLNVSASLFDQPLAGQTSPSIRALVLESPYSSHGYEAPLTLALRGENSFTGGITVTNSVLIIDGASALPTSGNVDLSRGYLGFTENHAAKPTAAQIATFFGRVTSYDNESVFGLDSVDRNKPVTLSSDIDLSFSNTRTGAHYLGTATKVILDGSITPTLAIGSTPDALQYAPLYLTAVKEGHLIVNSVLDKATVPSVVIGTRFPLGDADGTVELNGANTYTGGTLLQSGTLLVGHDSALGVGDLVVRNDFADAALASSNAKGVTLANPINLYGDYHYSLELGEENNSNPLTLNGSITGGDVEKVGPAKFTLGGANSFLTLDIEEGTLVFTNNDAALTTDGAWSFFINDGAAAEFTTAAPALRSLSGGGTVKLAGGSTLTLDIPITIRDEYSVESTSVGTTVTSGESTTYEETDMYWGTITGDKAALVKTGDGTLLLSGSNTYTGGTTAGGGTLVAQSNNAFGTGTVTVNGGALGLDHGVTLKNSLAFTSGTLTGTGTFAPINGGITVGAGQALSPGEEIGTLHFASDLTFAIGGMLNFEIGAPFGTPGADWDLVSVSGALAISAEAAPGRQFVINLLVSDASTPNSGQGEDEVLWGHTYTWTFATATGGIQGFTSTDQFLVNAAQLFADTGIPAADISVSLFKNTNGSSLVLNFTPVPEPSTYALMALGLGIVGLGAWRRRRE